MEYLSRLKKSKRLRPHSNCIGTALYLFKITDEDHSIGTLGISRITRGMLEQADDLERITFPEENVLVAFIPINKENPQITNVNHLGVITHHPRDIAKIGISSFVYQDLKKMLYNEKIMRTFYFREDFSEELNRRRQEVTRIIQKYPQFNSQEYNQPYLIHRAGEEGELCLDKLNFCIEVYRNHEALFFKRRKGVSSEKTLRNLLLNARLI